MRAQVLASVQFWRGRGRRCIALVPSRLLEPHRFVDARRPAVSPAARAAIDDMVACGVALLTPPHRDSDACVPARLLLLPSARSGQMFLYLPCAQEMILT